jgi:transposase
MNLIRGGIAMWTEEARKRHERKSERYPTDLNDAEWAIVAPLIPSAGRGGRHRTVDMREVMNALMYLLRTGCQWRMLPKDFPPRSTVYRYFRLFIEMRVWDQIHHHLLMMLREKMGREASPSAGIIDSQSVKGAEKGGIAITRRVTMQARRSRA